MPFTPTHIAAAVPLAWLCRWRVPFSALAIGTIVSDIPVYFPNLMSYATTHTMKGVLTHCTPVGLVLYYIYHGLLKRPLVDLLPRSLRNRLLPLIDRPIQFDPPKILLVTSLIAIGAASHVFWDSFTHAGRWGTEVFPWLQQIAFESSGRPWRWYAVLQHASSMLLLPPLVIGFLAWVLRQPEQENCDPRAQVPIAISATVIGLMFVSGCLRFAMITIVRPQYSTITALQLTVIQTGTVMLATLLLYCIGMQVFWSLRRGKETTDGGELDAEQAQTAEVT